MAEHAHVDHGGDKRIALLIAILALFLAVVETGAKSAQTEALARNIESAKYGIISSGVAPDTDPT